MRSFLFLVALVLLHYVTYAQTIRDYGIEIGAFKPGVTNTILDVPTVKVGHKTLIQGDTVRTGVTVVIPGDGNLFQQKMPAAIYLHNGFGKLAGFSQVEELGNIETPIVLTNTLSVPVAVQAVMEYTLGQKGNEAVKSVNPVVGETNDGYLNDIRGMHVKKAHVLEAILHAQRDTLLQGNVGAGTGTVCFGWKGGIGSSSRVLPNALGGYSIGVLVQTNFGGLLQVAGVPVGKLLDKFPFRAALEKADGSCMIIIITDAPLGSRNLQRLAKRGAMGLAKTGGIASNGSGDYVIAVSNHPSTRVNYKMKNRELKSLTLHNDAMSPLFMAAIEATEEAIINSLFLAKTTTGNGKTVEALPLNRVLEMLKKSGN